MEERIKELTLLLLYLTSWEEKNIPGEMRRSWKGYDFDILNQLSEQDFLHGGNRSKSVYLTEEGIEEAKKLAQKYIGQLDSN
ncbi:DUF6429 family protein [Sutcliffiella horikoshii]|uniref:DUF6429 family protein n=1 Tax=Sutcliffiella horikoshii TaxID=79883 RepID=UPI001CC09124|nr:DUF6429 family protein [Sutcliffiella horikoshii]UAL47951.1 DUF6429 family protein [Sutcliffiella horikoshii]